MREWRYTVMTSSNLARDPITTPAGSSMFINCRNLTFSEKMRKLNLTDTCRGQFSIHTGVNCVCVCNEGRKRKFGKNRFASQHFSS